MLQNCGKLGGQPTAKQMELLKVYWPAEGLLASMTLPSAILTQNPIPNKLNNKLTGSLCALLTGHSRLQSHKYELGLTLNQLVFTSISVSCK